MLLSESVSPCYFQRHNKSYKDDIVEKGETDSLQKETVLSGSEDEKQYSHGPPKEKKFKQDYQVHSFSNQRSIYTKTTENKEKGMKIVTLVSVDDGGDSLPKLVFQQSHEPLSENPNHSSTPVTNIMNINCSGSHVKLEIQEISQLNTSSRKTTFVFMNEGECAESFFTSKYERNLILSNESTEQPAQNVTSPNGNQNTNDRFTFGSTNEHAEAQSYSRSVSPTKTWDDPNYSQYCSDHKQQNHNSADLMLNKNPLLDIKPPVKRNHFHKSFSTDQFWDIPPPQEFADIEYNSLEDLTHDLASCRIGACGLADQWQKDFYLTPDIACTEESVCPFSEEADERADLSPSLDQSSESVNYEPIIMRPSLSMNGSSLTKDFINHQKKKSWIRNNSIATVEQRVCLLPKKRRQTFPGMSESLGSMQEDFLVPFMSEGKQSLLSPYYTTTSEDNPDHLFTVNEQCQRQSSIRCRHNDFRQQDIGVKQSLCEAMGVFDTDYCGYKVDQTEVADSGYEQEMGEVEYHSPEPPAEQLCRSALAIQVIPPSCSGSEEQMLQNHPVMSFHNNKVKNANQEDLVSVLHKHSEPSVMTLTVGALEERFLPMDSRSLLGSCMEKHSALDDPCMSPSQDNNVNSLNTNNVTKEQLNTARRGTDDSDKPTVTAPCPPKDSTGTEVSSKEQLSKNYKADKQTVSRCKLQLCNK